MAVTKDEVKVGDFVKYTEGYGRHENAREALVTSVARVWITVTTGGKYAREMRFRLDTQTDSPGPNGGAYSPRFYTIAQWEWREAETSAIRYLREQGINVIYDSPWSKRLVELADIIRKGEQDSATHHDAE
jgi:hypothetical protein